MLYAVAAWGMALWQEALLFGLISALSLPIGAFLGQRMSPVNDGTVAAVVAFGAGALLFAVTVELYGHALHEVAHGAMGYTEMFATVGCALLGALLYLYLNKMMEEWMEKQDEEEANEGARRDMEASEPASSSSAGPTRAWDRLRQRTAEIGEELRKSRGVVSAKEAIAMITQSNSNKEKMDLIKGRQKRMLIAAVASTPKAKPEGSSTLERAKTPEELAEEEEEEKRVAKGLKLAQSMFLGLLVDGIPESILLGFLAAEHSLSLVLVLSLFVANFPEAFSSASLMKEAGVPVFKIIGMWSALCVLTGVLAALACAGLLYIAGEAAASGAMPFHIAITIAIVEGIAGGAMIACIASVMLPEAFARKNQGSLLMDSGFLCTAGFLTAVLIKVTGGYVDSQDIKEAPDKIKVPEEGHPGPHNLADFGFGAHDLVNWGLGHSLMYLNPHLNPTNVSTLVHVAEHVFRAGIH
jgi:hypothetical protein